MNKTVLRCILGFVILLVYSSLVFLIGSLLASSGFVSAPRWSLVLLAGVFLAPVTMLLNDYCDKLIFRTTVREILKQKKLLDNKLRNYGKMKSVAILAAGVAHEIKNPLAAISTFTEYLPTKYDDSEFRKKFIRIVQAEVKRLTGIIQSLLVFSRSTEQNIRIFDVNEVIQEILDLESPELLIRRIEVEHVKNAPNALADPEQIKQALLNIILNAMDAMQKKGGKLIVRTRPCKYGIEIVIEDTGCGMATDKMEHIFNPFHSDKEKGTGLGLAVTHSIIENNKGRISVKSELGKGTQFTVCLPKAIEAAYYSHPSP